jgi:DHA1 family multidrug resistance protein-like MFS transporter
MFAIGIVTPIVPLYASRLGASWTDLGLLGTVWGTTLMILGILSGRLSDRYGRKPLLVASGMFSAVVALLYLASSTVLQVILIRILEGAAWALFWPTMEALATEIVEPRAAGRAMGMATASYGIAFATSSLAGGYITSILSYSGTFTAYLALSLISTVAAILLLHRSWQREFGTVVNKTHARLDYSSLRSPTILLAYFLGGAYTFGFGMIITLFSVFANTLGVTVFLIGALFGCFWLGRIVGSFGGGRLSDKLGRGSVVLISMSGSALGFVLVALSTSFELLLGGIIVLGLSIGAIFPTVVALISDEVSQSVRGHAMGTFEATCAVGFLSAATVGGLLSDLYSPRAPYLLAAAVSLASIIIFVARRPKHSPVTSSEDRD